MQEELWNAPEELRKALLQQQLELSGIYSFKAMAADELTCTPLKATPFIIADFMSTGLHILGGPPKIGKSWLILWMAIQIAKGEPVWNMETAQGTVLYLALEDNLQRLQSRLIDIVGEDIPSHLYITTESKTLGDGLESQIDSFMKEHPDTKLIIIDTFQKIRAPSFVNKGMYSQDYQEVGKLKSMADSYGIAILLVHHLRKQHDSDPMNMLNGSTGLTGAADSTYVMQKWERVHDGAVLHISGRDIMARTIQLVFRNDKHCWLLASENPEMIKLKDPTSDLVIRYLEVSNIERFQGTATELTNRIYNKLGETLTPSAMSKQLLIADERFKALGYEVKLIHPHGPRQVIIRRIKEPIATARQENEEVSPATESHT